MSTPTGNFSLTDHRAEAARWLAAADERNNFGDSDSYVQAAALIGIGHALLAGPANHCQSCGTERRIEHDAWCETQPTKEPAA